MTMASSNVTRRELLAVTAVTGGALVGGQRMPGAVSPAVAQSAATPTPTLARVHGPAIAGGMGLVSACDIAIASSRAVFATSEVKFGIIPSAISPYVIAAVGER